MKLGLHGTELNNQGCPTPQPEKVGELNWFISVPFKPTLVCPILRSGEIWQYRLRATD
ncbi:hypothetical protein K9N68_04175 [Kovacikia minuta CCNUW1]|uniref:hypothetical protein n=1 Tax=Kovacikia minuta TaxID=2931930 RepID=UPI001CCD90E5|nr:hypothetical protein [Kovacikia minuta]UBF27171.1 hypothetical protein K9N68_04175 [Kovacikia minuta CCNUW1]